MNENLLYPAALEVQEFCQREGWRCCLIGGMAVNRWGNPRVTQDVDFTLLTGFGNEELFVDKMLGKFRARRPDAREFALLSRVLLIETANGTFADIALAGFPYEEEMIRRASPFAYRPDVLLVTASAEDIIVLKAFAARPRDWGDVEDIIVCQQDVLDWKYILKQLKFLAELKDAPELVDELQRLRKRVEARRK